MQKFILKLFLLLFIGYIVYKNRYRLINNVLGFQAIRHFVVSKTFSIPGFRERLFDRF